MTESGSSLVDGAESAESLLGEYSWVVVPSVLVEGVDDAHFCLGQGEIEDGDVLGKALNLAGLGDGRGASLYGPSEEHLSVCLTMASGDLSDLRQVDEGLIGPGHSELNI